MNVVYCTFVCAHVKGGILVMKKKLALIISLMMAMAFGLAACGNDFDAAGYVRESLNAIQTGTVSDELVNMSQENKEDLQASIDSLRTETEQSLLTAMGDQQANLTDKAKKSINEAVDGLFTKMKFEVAEEATKEDDKYIVTVKAYPMKCFGKFMDHLNGDFLSEWTKKAAGYTSQEKLLKDMYEACFADLAEMVNNTEYGDPQDMTITVAPNSDGIYEADQADVEKLVAVLLGTGDLN